VRVLKGEKKKKKRALGLMKKVLVLHRKQAKFAGRGEKNRRYITEPMRILD